MQYGDVVVVVVDVGIVLVVVVVWVVVVGVLLPSATTCQVPPKLEIPLPFA